MITHKVKFTARPIGAIGKTFAHSKTLQLPKPDHDGESAIRKLLSEDFKDIMNIQVNISESQLKRFYRDRERAQHIQAIEKLSKLCGGSKLQPETISNRLRSIERAAKDAAIKYSNDSTYKNLTQDEEKAKKDVQKLFNGKLQGLFIGGEPRGYQLKIDESLLRENGIYYGIGLHIDLGSDGLLAPDIN